MTAPVARSVKPARRSILNWLLGAGIVSWAVSVLYPVFRYLRPLSEVGAGGPLKLSADELATLEKSHFVIVRSGTRKVIVFEANGMLHALDAKCTHEGCTVQFVSGDSLLWCACHNGKFDLDGRVISGPPPRPLAKWMATREGTDVVLTMEKA
ncbi:MAG TPA: Rieske 2Fe-2S domain-containing protein [Myxococcaceae bacterium]|nr:Rieske 2Fe-2S domain-containing protein [Myxococcaceae bacterium]